MGECYFGGIRGVVSGHHFLTFSFSWSLFFSGQSLLSEFYGNVAMKWKRSTLDMETAARDTAEDTYYMHLDYFWSDYIVITVDPEKRQWGVANYVQIHNHWAGDSTQLLCEITSKSQPYKSQVNNFSYNSLLWKGEERQAVAVLEFLLQFCSQICTVLIFSVLKGQKRRALVW